jgi:hypothetical protein
MIGMKPGESAEVEIPVGLSKIGRLENWVHARPLLLEYGMRHMPVKTIAFLRLLPQRRQVLLTNYQAPIANNELDHVSF